MPVSARGVCCRVCVLCELDLCVCLMSSVGAFFVMSVKHERVVEFAETVAS